MKHEELTARIIGAAIEVHRHLGPGLLESVYETCLARELALQGIPFESQKQVLVHYKDVQVASDLRADFIVGGIVVVELKAVDCVLPIHRAQVLTYMRLTGCEVGLLINFNVEQLVKGVERFVL
jgi:GxxExxY protein